MTDFVVLPLTLGVLTAAYNFLRFDSFLDFGYTHIPDVLREPWYNHGLFSLHAIPWNIHKMLFEGFGDRPRFPISGFILLAARSSSAVRSLFFFLERVEGTSAYARSRLRS